MAFTAENVLAAEERIRMESSLRYDFLISKRFSARRKGKSNRRHYYRSIHIHGNGRNVQRCGVGGAEREMRQQAAPNTSQFLEYHFPNDFVTMFHMALVH